VVTTTLSSGAGNDSVRVFATSGPLNVNGAGGLDTVTLGGLVVGMQGTVANIRGAVTVTNPTPGGGTTLIVDDSADPIGRVATVSESAITGLAPAPITYDQTALSALVILGGSGGNTFTVTNTPNNSNGVTTALSSGSGNDTVAVLATTGALVIDGAGGSDAVTLGSAANGAQGIGGAVAVQNSRGVTALTANDSGNPGPTSATISAGAITGLSPAPITYQPNDLSALNIIGGSGNDVFLIAGTATGQHALLTTLFTGSGDNVIILQGGGGPFLAIGGNGNNTLKGPDDQATWTITGLNTGTVFSNSLGSPFSFFNVQNLAGGNGGNSFIFTDGNGITGTIDGGNGPSTLDYRAYSTTVVVDLALGTATGTGGVSSIRQVYGGVGFGSATVYNILVGTNGSELIGGNGRRNLLIAGNQPASLTGGDWDDILIGGSTNYDMNLTQLNAIMAEWAGTDDYATRVAALKAGTSGVPVLNKTKVWTNVVGGSHVHNQLTGNGGSDWYFGQQHDTTDRGSGERFTHIHHRRI
jgi:hypothetical protein